MVLQPKQSNRQRRRRAPRASQACECCAAAKARCDNNERCQRCQKRNISCIRPPSFSENTSSTTRKQEQPPDILHQRNDISNGLSEFDLDVLVGSWPGRDAANSRPPEQSHHRIDRFSQNSESTQSGLSEEVQNRSHSAEEGLKMPAPAFPIIDFSFTPFIHGTIPQTQETPKDNLESLFNSVFGLSNVAMAFERTVGPWNPDWSNHRAAEEANIYLESAVQSIDPHSAIPRLHYSSPGVVSADTRDEILAMILTNCERTNAIRVASAFPSAGLISELLLRFLESHALEEDTWIHVPTFKANQAPPELLMAFVASSAMESTNSALRRFGKALHSVLHPYLFQVFEKNIIRTRQLQYIQALALFIHTGLWSGDKRKMEISEAIVGCVIQMLRSGGYYRYSTYNEIVPSTEDTGEILEAKWHEWIREESFKRIVWHMQVHCSKESLATGKRPPVACAELLLPFPRHQELWIAGTASKWKEIYLSLNSQSLPRTITIREALSRPMTLLSLPDVYDFELAQLIVLHCIFPMIRDYQQARVLCGPEDEDMDMTRTNILANESEQQRLVRLLQSMRMLNESQKTPKFAYRSLIIEIMSMHLFAPFEQIELAAGREGLDEAKTAYLSAQGWSKRCQARQAVWNAGQAVRYLREIPSTQFTPFYAVVAYQACLCLWMYGTIAAINTQPLSDDGPSSSSAHCYLDTDETVNTQQWINFNRGIPAICKPVWDQSTSQGSQIPLSSAQEVIICLRELLQYKVSEHGANPLTSAMCDLISALSTVRPGLAC